MELLVVILCIIFSPLLFVFAIYGFAMVIYIWAFIFAMGVYMVTLIWMVIVAIGMICLMPFELVKAAINKKCTKKNSLNG